MVVSLSYITVMEQKMSGKTKSSVGAFFNADSGIEWALNKIASGSGKIGDVFGTSTPGSGISCPDFGSGSPCKIYLLDADGKVITDSNVDLSGVKAVRSIGTQGGETTRAVEAAVAAGGGVSFVYYCNLASDLLPNPPNVCTDAGGTQGHCPSGFKQVYALGSWGYCGAGSPYNYFRPPGGGCNSDSSGPFTLGEAYVCSQ